MGENPSCSDTGCFRSWVPDAAQQAHRFLDTRDAPQIRIAQSA
jgi:hypothetical protein